MTRKKGTRYRYSWFLLVGLAYSLYSESISTVSDASYIVKKGDTLWDLAFTFLGDPFLWPQIWNANPSITNPDLIYPGFSLSIPGRTSTNTTLVSEQVISEEPVAFSSPISDQVAINDSMKNEYDALSVDSVLFNSLNNKNPFDGSFYAKVPFLWTEKDPQGNIYPGKGIVSKPENASYQQFDKITISPQVPDYFLVGDTLDIYSSIRFVEYEGKTANIVKRVGKCRILESAPNKIIAELFEQWDVICGLERVEKAIYFDAASVDSLFTAQIDVTGTIFTRVEESPSPYPYQTVIIDKGSQDGVEIGDVFGIYHVYGKNGVQRLTMVGIVSHINDRSSSLVLVTMLDNVLTVGDKVVLVRKIRFSRKEN